MSEKLTTKKLINKPRYVIEAGGMKASMKKDVLALLRDNFTIRVRMPNGRKSHIHVKRFVPFICAWASEDGS